MLSSPQIIRAPRDRGIRLGQGDRAKILKGALAVGGRDTSAGDAELARILEGVCDPLAMERRLDELLRLGRSQAGLSGGDRVRVRGTLDSRLLLIPTPTQKRFVLASLGPVLEVAARDLPDGVRVARPDGWLSVADVDEQALYRLDRPQVKLVSLYHPENFPLPRFALGISDIARSLRKQMLGTVSLSDMQLGPTPADIVAEIERERPDIIGISSTFGQHDVFETVVEGIGRIPDYRPLLVTGGSLSVLNADHLAGRGIVVALGPGELTMAAVIRHWLYALPLETIPGACFRTPEGEIRRTGLPSNRLHDDILPELDLLAATLDRGGVMQLESSRGCSYACSFCPREHKGIWTGENPSALELLLPDVSEIFDSRRHVARKIFLVDEEFYGYRPESEDRVSGVADVLAKYGFRYETSSRVDQVWRHNRDREWHVERMRSWRGLVAKGLDRCLFGVESGVQTILKRFNKKTTPAQNAIAVRLLTAMGVPIRCTYITFDPLMNIEELQESFAFQGRTDLILWPQPELSEEELLDLVTDEDWVSAYSTGKPFYSAISYMLVSMECLIGSPYLAQVEAKGLARDINRSMGRRDAVYADPSIGAMSYTAQSWVDRNFSFDYMLKSLEKVTEGEVWRAVRGLRLLFKRSAYDLLGMMIKAHPEVAGRRAPALRLKPADGGDGDTLLDSRFAALVAEVEPGIDRLAAQLHPAFADKLRQEHRAWRERTGWGHINAT